MFTTDIEYLIGRSPVILTELPADAPPDWVVYLGGVSSGVSDMAERDLAVLSSSMPDSFSALKSTLREAFLVSDGKRTLRVLNQEMDGEGLYSWISRPPVGEAGVARHPIFFSRAPKDFAEIYAHHFDGLYDASRFGGPICLDDMVPLSSMLDDFADHAWYPQMATLERPEEIWLIFSSGGGGYLFLDLRDDKRDVTHPTCLLVMNDDEEEPEFEVDLWAHLDAWTALAMGA